MSLMSRGLEATRKVAGVGQDGCASVPSIL